jgi:hypothetical protein
MIPASEICDAIWIKELIQVAAMCVRTIQDCTQSNSLELATRKYE